jgi:hypothetical protein
MTEEMIREKDIYKGCFFTGCLSFIVGGVLLAVFFGKHRGVIECAYLWSI